MAPRLWMAVGVEFEFGAVKSALVSATAKT
jgi:hypothetical protein